jgi:hypothetical protein
MHTPPRASSARASAAAPALSWLDAQPHSAPEDSGDDDAVGSDGEDNGSDGDVAAAAGNGLFALGLPGGNVSMPLSRAFARHGQAEAFAPSYLRSVLADADGRSLHSHFRDTVVPEWRHSSASKHCKEETFTLARILDALLRSPPDLDEAFERATRRLATVHMGADTGNWEAGEVLCNGSSRSYYMPRKMMGQVLKEVKLLELLRKSAPTGGSARAFTKGGSSTGRSARDRNERTSRSAGGDKPHTGADSSSRQGKGASGSGSIKK